METDTAAQDPLGIFAEINGRLQRENFESPCPISIVVEVEEHRFILYSTALPVQFIAKTRVTKDGRVKGLLDVPDVIIHLTRSQLRECATRIHQSREDLHWWLVSLPLRGVPVVGWYKMASALGLGLQPPVSRPVAIAGCCAGAVASGALLVKSTAVSVAAMPFVPSDDEATPVQSDVWAALRELAT